MPTIDEWNAALSSSYKQSQVKDQGDGITEFMATFGSQEKSDFALSLGSRDAFRKLRIFQGGIPTIFETCVKAYVSVIDGEKPVLLLRPYYRGESWLFMKKLALMVDGNVVLEHELELQSSDRRTHGGGVEESQDFILDSRDIEALRKITKASNVIIRITGDKGYVSLIEKKKESSIVLFKLEVISALRIYDAIDKAVKGHIPPTLEK